jgi:hypothetical protein
MKTQWHHPAPYQHDAWDGKLMTVVYHLLLVALGAFLGFLYLALSNFQCLGWSW